MQALHRNKLNSIDFERNSHLLFSVGDDSFVKVGSNLGILAAPILNYPADVYKLVLRTNPESTYNQVTIRIDSTLGP